MMIFLLLFFLFIDTLDDSLRSQTTKTMKNYNLGFFWKDSKSLLSHEEINSDILRSLCVLNNNFESESASLAMFVYMYKEFHSVLLSALHMSRHSFKCRQQKTLIQFKMI